MPIRWHADDPELLVQAIEFTARQTGFNPRLVEKDYFCSVVLEHLAAADEALTFKGGTCLAKIYGSLYRISEDLDFSLSTPTDASRAERSRKAAPLKALIDTIPKVIPSVALIEPLRGANQSTQYNAVVGYGSLLSARVEPIAVEVGLREPALEAPAPAPAKTLLLDPLRERPLVDTFPVRSLSRREAMAEKLRAALTRRDVAIRDYFDVDHAARIGGLAADDPVLLELLRRKLAVPGTAPVDLSPDRLGRLRGQLEPELRPVLREPDFDLFDLERALETVRTIAHMMAARPSG